MWRTQWWANPQGFFLQRDFLVRQKRFLDQRFWNSTVFCGQVVGKRVTAGCGAWLVLRWVTTLEHQVLHPFFCTCRKTRCTSWHMYMWVAPLSWWSPHRNRSLRAGATRMTEFHALKVEPRNGTSVKIGTIQRRLAWSLRKDDTH